MIKQKYDLGIFYLLFLLVKSLKRVVSISMFKRKYDLGIFYIFVLVRSLKGEVSINMSKNVCWCRDHLHIICFSKIPKKSGVHQYD